MAYFIDDLADLAKKMFETADIEELRRKALDRSQPVKARKEAIDLLYQCGKRGRKILESVANSTPKDEVSVYASVKIQRKP
ncbi:MAG: hypothetical protein QXI37_03800 [Thermoprotei archaeon]